MIVVPEPSWREVLRFRDHIAAILHRLLVSYQSIKSRYLSVPSQFSGLYRFHPYFLSIRPLDDCSTHLSQTVFKA